MVAAPRKAGASAAWVRTRHGAQPAWWSWACTIEKRSPIRWAPSSAARQKNSQRSALSGKASPVTGSL